MDIVAISIENATRSSMQVVAKFNMIHCNFIAICNNAQLQLTATYCNFQLQLHCKLQQIAMYPILNALQIDKN